MIFYSQGLDNPNYNYDLHKFKVFMCDNFAANQDVEKEYPGFGGDYFEELSKYVDENWDYVSKLIGVLIEKQKEEFDKLADAAFVAMQGGGEKVEESVFGDIRRRADGNAVRKEDEITQEEMEAADEFLVHYATRIVYDGYKFSLDGICDYIEDNKREGVVPVSDDINLEHVLRYVKDCWADELSDRLSEYVDLENEEMEKQMRECAGVPGGATPADVGGMGPIACPGELGPAGSGDLPSPTGIVYHQVAPFTIFKEKKRKKKKKKFRKEDEPCVHSPNAKVYDYVDDFREYVDRTYNNIDRK